MVHTGLHHLVVLVPDLAHQLLQDVLHGDDAHGPAVAVRHDGHVDLLAAHNAEELVDLGALVDEVGLVQEAAQVGLLPLLKVLPHEAADLQDADDVVHAVLIDRDAAVAGGLHLGEDLLQRVVHVDGLHVHPGGEDALRRQIAEGQGGMHEIPLLRVQVALVRHVLDDVVELVLGDGDLAVALGEAARELTDLGKDEGNGRQQVHEEHQGGRRAQGQPEAVLLGDALGQHLTHEEDHEGGDEGAESHRAEAPAAGDEDRHIGRAAEMYDVGADENGGDGLIKMLADVHGLVGPAVSPLHGGLQPDAADSGKAGLADGKVVRKEQQGENDKDGQYTPIIHKGLSHSKNRFQPSPAGADGPFSRTIIIK